MKNILALFTICMAFTGCIAPGGAPQEPSERQMRLADMLSTYVLPKESIPPALKADQPASTAVAAAYSIAISQGLIADASYSNEGIIFAGKKEEDRQIVVVVQFFTAPDGRLVLEDTSRWKAIDNSSGTRMRQRLITALGN